MAQSTSAKKISTVVRIAVLVEAGERAPLGRDRHAPQPNANNIAVSCSTPKKRAT
jgi:hypothetical protein